MLQLLQIEPWQDYLQQNKPHGESNSMLTLALHNRSLSCPSFMKRLNKYWSLIKDKNLENIISFSRLNRKNLKFIALI